MLQSRSRSSRLTELIVMSPGSRSSVGKKEVGTWSSFGSVPGVKGRGAAIFSPVYLWVDIYAVCSCWLCVLSCVWV